MTAWTAALVLFSTASVLCQTTDDNVRNVLSLVQKINTNIEELTKRVARVENRQLTIDLLSDQQLKDVQSRLSKMEAAQAAQKKETFEFFQQLQSADNKTANQNKANFQTLATALISIEASVEKTNAALSNDMSKKLTYLTAANNLTHAHLATIQNCCTSTASSLSQGLGSILRLINQTNHRTEERHRISPSSTPSATRPTDYTNPMSTRYDNRFPEDCKTVFERGLTQAGDYSIQIRNMPASQVWCEAGATVIQRRHNGDIQFDRSWADYVRGFGVVRGDYWMGLSMMHAMTSQHQYSMVTEFHLDDAANRAAGLYKTELKDGDGTVKYVAAREFSVGAGDGYRLRVIGVTSNLGATYGVSRIESYHGGMAFSARDKDQDGTAFQNCAKEKEAGWWHNACYYFNPNTKHGNDRVGSCSVNNRVCARLVPYTVTKIQMKLTRC